MWGKWSQRSPRTQQQESDREPLELVLLSLWPSMPGLLRTWSLAPWLSSAVTKTVLVCLLRYMTYTLKFSTLTAYFDVFFFPSTSTFEHHYIILECICLPLQSLETPFISRGLSLLGTLWVPLPTWGWCSPHLVFEQPVWLREPTEPSEGFSKCAPEHYVHVLFCFCYILLLAGVGMGTLLWNSGCGLVAMYARLACMMLGVHFQYCTNWT